MSDHSVVLFYSTNGAVWADRLFRKEGIDAKLIPVPRHLSSDCGYSVRIPAADAGRAQKLMETTGIEYEKIAEL